MVTTTNKGLAEPANGDLSWDVPLNANFEIIDKAFGSSVTISLTGLTTYAVSAVQAQNMSMYFTGTPTSGVSVTIPSSTAGQWVVRNGSNKSLTVSSLAGGAGTVTIVSGATRSIYCDGNDVFYADSQTFGVDNGEVAYSAGGVLTGSPDLTFDGTELSVGASASVTGASTSGGGPYTATVTFSGTKAVPTGSTVAVAGVTPADYNGSWEVTASSSGSVSYFVPASLTSGSGGSVAYGTVTVGGGPVSVPNVNENRTAGVTTSAVDDGTKSTGTYTPSPTNGNMRTIINNGAFTLAAPTAAGDYTLVVQITNGATAGAVTLAGFTRTSGDALTTTNTSKFFVFITKCNGLTLAVVQALQ